MGSTSASSCWPATGSSGRASRRRHPPQATRQPQATVEEALAIALTTTAKPTLTAALAAAIAYGSLALTKFRGFQQFGEVGGLGMILCWAFTYSYGPALIFLWERIRRPKPQRAHTPRTRIRIAAAIIAHPRALLAAVGVLTLLAAWSIAPLVRSPFEYDFSKLRNQQSRKHGAGDLYVRVGRIFPQDLAPVGIALAPPAPTRRRRFATPCWSRTASPA